MRKRRAINKHSDDGNVTTATSYGNNGLLQAQYVYKYDDGNNKIEEQVTYLKGKDTSRNHTTHKYDNNNGRLLETTYGNDNSQALAKTIFTYDNSGNKIASCKYASYKGRDSLCEKTTYSYNSDDVPTGWETYVNSILRSTAIYNYDSYDKSGNPLKETLVNPMENSPLSKINIAHAIAYY